jgi:hypothetical protein
LSAIARAPPLLISSGVSARSITCTLEKATSPGACEATTTYTARQRPKLDEPLDSTIVGFPSEKRMHLYFLYPGNDSLYCGLVHPFG